MPSVVEVYNCVLGRSPEQIRTPVMKVGGCPSFFHPTLWPHCAMCGQAMDFLIQIPLQEPIAFSHSYAMAYIFMCPGKFDERGWLTCHTWEPYLGANVVILQNESANVYAPDCSARYPDYAVTLVRSSEPLYHVGADEFDEELNERVSRDAKVGGVPGWIQTDETPLCLCCGANMRFVAQLHAALDGPLSANAKDDEKYEFLDFGDVGTGYLFLCENECCDRGVAFLWQCY